LMVRDAVKHPVPAQAPFPGALKGDNDAPVVEEEAIVATEVEATDVPAVEAVAPVEAEAAPVETPVVDAPVADATEKKPEGEGA
jgi:large subunit ribosomal protein L3